MKVLLDTSVLTAALVKVHPAHTVAVAWLRRIQNGHIVGFINAHALAELYSNLTRIPFEPRIRTDEIAIMYENDIRNQLKIVSLSGDDYLNVIDYLRQKGLVGGIIYDALHVFAGIKVGVDWIVTLNSKDFRRIYPEWASHVISPLEDQKR